MLNKPFILQVTGYKNSGKTTLITSFIQHLKEKYNWNVITIKHDAHGFQLDQKDTDTYKHREAGASLSMIQSEDGIGITLTQEREKDLEHLIQLGAYLQPCEMIIIEGFKQENMPKLLLLRKMDDFQLIQQLSLIEALVFQSNELLQNYRRDVSAKLYPFYPSFLLTEQAKLIAWLDQFINQRKDS